MPGITAILHTHNDELRIARAIESLRSCDEVLVIDHGSSDETCGTARQFGARVIKTDKQKLDTQAYLPEAQHDWIFSMLPTESLSERLEASVLEWKFGNPRDEMAFGVYVLEEEQQVPETRLVNRTKATWNTWRPVRESQATFLDGHLLRIGVP